MSRDRIAGYTPPTPEESATMELRWQRRRTGLSMKGVEDRAKELIAIDPEPDAFVASGKAKARKARRR